MGSVNAEKPLSVLEDALKGGITCFQLREKGARALVGMEKKAFAESCQRLCAQYGVPFIVNDDVDLAVEIDADGVHVGQDDVEARFVRKRIGTEKIVGVSVHTVGEATKAIADGADYVGMGPVYRTITKADAKPVAGTAMIAEIAAVYPDLPIVGIGGITAENAEPIFRAGASGISVISAIASSTDPELAASRLAEVSLKWSRERGVLR
ncbi:thiamine phosphate synthase [Sporosarcina luteola]|uniref:thiamine phosphate synthase n=1 Tax=Sporosarcina luteola TaxID=582850 RepID=UPI002040237D|nr:thiamine phosphate synthase [Sporosarcina luteola]MCM3638836.1 thiamine phosphate synthase [Sporosarcina luteola]